MTTSQNIDLKRLLHESKDKYNNSLYDHICNVLSYIDNGNSNMKLEEFEQLSHFLSANKYTYNKYKASHELIRNSAQDAEKNEKKQHFQVISNLIGFKDNNPKAYVQDFYNVNFDWNIAGYGFEEETAKLIDINLKKISVSHRCESVNFLGIVSGSKRDYFVAYGRLLSHVKDLISDEYEENGVGTNSISFWVTNESSLE